MNKNILKFLFVLIVFTGAQEVLAQQRVTVTDGGGAGTFTGGGAELFGQKDGVVTGSQIDAAIDVNYDIPSIIAMTIADETNTVPTASVFGINPAEVGNLFKPSKFNYPTAPTDSVINHLHQTNVEDYITAATETIPLILNLGSQADFEINGILFAYPRDLFLTGLVGATVNTDPSCDSCIFLDGPNSARIKVNLAGIIGDPAGNYNPLEISGAETLQGFIMDDTMISPNGYAALRIGGNVDGGSMSVDTTPPGIYSGKLTVSFSYF